MRGPSAMACVLLLSAASCARVVERVDLSEGESGGASSTSDSGPTSGSTMGSKAASTSASSMQSGTPYVCSHVESMITDHPGYTNWVGAWFDVTADDEGERFGTLLPFDEPNTPTVEEQFYYDEMPSPAPSVLAIGPSNAGDMPEQILTVTTDAGVLQVYMPSLHPEDCVRTRLYVAADGSTYHSRADHTYTYSPLKENVYKDLCFGHGSVGPDLTPEEAMTPEHLARAAP